MKFTKIWHQIDINYAFDVLAWLDIYKTTICFIKTPRCILFNAHCTSLSNQVFMKSCKQELKKEVEVNSGSYGSSRVAA
jgi:hypothetical protein